MKLHQIIDALAAEPSTNAKLAILKKFQDRYDLKLYFKAVLDPFINYYIRVKDVPEQSGTLHLTDDMISDVIYMLNDRVVTGNAARDYINSMMVDLSTENQQLLKNMINRDANCKVAEGLVNKCWKDLIPEFPCMLADKFDAKNAKNIPEGNNKIIVQKKEDGGRVAIAVSHDHAVTVYSRNGNVLETHGVFDAMFNRFPGKVFDGELLVVDDQGMQDRKTSNGIFNKAVRGTISKEEAVKFHAVLWDVISYDSWKAGYDATPYIQRLAVLTNALSSVPSHRASLVESKMVSTHAEAQKFYEKMVDQGFEGAIVKCVEMPWEARRSKSMLKLKEINDATLLCVGVQKHSKNPAWIGSLECESACGKLKVSIGSGLSEEDREQDPSYFIGKLIDLQYNMLIQAKGSDTHSLFLPRYRGIRLDQKVADTVDKLK